jgi:CHAT domain
VASYSELRVRFERTGAEAGSYDVLATGPAGETTGHFRLPLTPLELENLALRLSRGRNVVRRVDSPELDLVRGLGGSLFEALFSGKVRDLYRDSFAVARQEGRGLRVTLALTGAPELMHVPWEYLYDDPGFLSISTWTPVVRYLDLPRGRRPLEVTGPLQILAVVSGPSDVVELDTGREQATLEQALAKLTAKGALEIHWLKSATLQELQRELRQRDYHIFHFIGHGGYDSAREDGVLLFEEETGRSRPVSGAQLGTMLADETSLRLAVLNSCEGARTSSDDPFAGTAASLVHREIPAVVAMQFEITDRAAVVFGGEFYAALADGYPVDSALAEARKAIFADQNDVEWGTPVLFMRVADGRIFDVAADPASEKPALPETTPVVPPPPPPAVEPEPVPAMPAPVPPTAESPPPARAVTTDRVLLGAAVLSLVGAVLLAIGVRFPWDFRGRSWLDLKFGTDGIENSGLFTGFAPVALVLGTLTALGLAFRPRTRDLGAGLLIGFGVAGAAKYLGLLGLVLTESATRGWSAVVFTGVVAGAVLLVVAGVRVALLNPTSVEPAAPLGILVPALLVGAAVLSVIGLVTPFNGKLDRKVVPDEDWLAIDPLVIPLAALGALVLLTSGRRLLAAGLLIALGIASATLWLRYLGVPIIAPDNAGSFGAGAAAGLAGGVMILAAGLVVWRREASVRAVPS